MATLKNQTLFITGGSRGIGRACANMFAEHGARVAVHYHRNQAAAEVMTKHRIAIDDLYTAITPHLTEMQNPKDVHFNAKGYDFLGETVAKAVETALK